MWKTVSFLPFMSIFLVLWGNSNYVPPVKTFGFYCNDTALSMPYHGDSISALMLFSILLSGGAIVLFISEGLDQTNSTNSDYKYYLKYFYSGFSYVLAFTEILKLTCGELRPHFISTCQPDIDPIKCSDGLITDFKCTGRGPQWLVNNDIYKSFPSGHASLSTYVLIFLTMHVHARLRLKKNLTCVLWKHLMPTICLAWTIVCCASRIADHRHFWWDVLAGIAIGLIGGFVMLKFTVNNLTTQKILGREKLS